MDMILSKHWEIGESREAWCAAVHGVSKSQHNLVTEQQHLQNNILLEIQNDLERNYLGMLLWLFLVCCDS